MNQVNIMGILNVTPDSFSDGGMYFNDLRKATERVQQMLTEGADIIDIGGESTRPGSKGVSADEEIRRIVPLLKNIRETLGSNPVLSVDTNKAVVAEEALQNGANMINSLGGFTCDHHLIAVIKKHHCQCIFYHIRGVPETMQQGDMYADDVVKDITGFFTQQLQICKANGIAKSRLILDPGIGFGKTVEQNLTIIKRLDTFRQFGVPILIGVSRKSHLGALLQMTLQLTALPSPLERLEASLAETAIAILHGATMIRTHDVAQTKKFITVLEALL